MTSARATLAALLAGHVISRTGNVVGVFAVPFLVLSTGGSAIEVGLAAAAGTLPVVIAGPIGGLIVDRFGALRISVVADIVSGLTFALIPILSATSGLSFSWLLFLLFLGALLDTPGETARRVVLPEVAEAAGVRMEQAVGFLDATTRMSTLLGAPIAGVLVAWLGAPTTFVFTAIAFGVAAVLTLALMAGPIGRALRPAPAEEPGSVWTELTAGVRFVIREPVLRLIVSVLLITNLLDAARLSTLMPLYANEFLDGPAALGIISGCFGGAALAGSVLFGFIAHRVPRRPVLVIGFLGATIPSMLAPVLGAGVWWMAATALVSGLFAGSLNPTLGAIQLERIPEKLRGRVFGATAAGAWAGMPLGSLLGGVTADFWGVRIAFAVALGIYVLVITVPFLGRTGNNLNRPSA